MSPMMFIATTRLASRAPAALRASHNLIKITHPRIRSISNSVSLHAPKAQSVSPLAPLGVAAAFEAANDPATVPKPKIFEEFALTDRVAIVSGANRGLGLEMAVALCEAGARAVYCFDLPKEPSEEWHTCQKFIERLGNNSRLEYVSVNVTDQQAVWARATEIGDKEKRMDVCVAAAGILKAHTDCLEYPAEQFKQASLSFSVGSNNS